MLSDEKKILGVVEQETRELAGKYGDKRRTEIRYEEIGESSIEDFIKEEDVVVVISHKGFVKRVPVDEYRSQGRGGKGVRGAALRDEDFVEHLFVASTHEYVMFVTNLGKAYWIRPRASRRVKNGERKQYQNVASAGRRRGNFFDY